MPWRTCQYDIFAYHCLDPALALSVKRLLGDRLQCTLLHIIVEYCSVLYLNQSAHLDRKEAPLQFHSTLQHLLYSICFFWNVLFELCTEYMHATEHYITVHYITLLYLTYRAEKCSCSAQHYPLLWLHRYMYSGGSLAVTVEEPTRTQGLIRSCVVLQYRNILYCIIL